MDKIASENGMVASANAFYLTFDFQTVWVKKNHIWVHSVGQGLRQMENHQHGAISTDI